MIKEIDVDGETGETTVIIKFTDPEKAKDFVRNVSEGRTPGSILKRVRTVPAEQDSFAGSQLPVFSATTPLLFIL